MMLKFNVLVVGDIVSTVFSLLLFTRRLAAAILMKNQVLACQLGTAALRYISNRGGNNDINETNNQIKSQDSPSAIGCYVVIHRPWRQLFQYRLTQRLMKVMKGGLPNNSLLNI